MLRRKIIIRELDFKKLHKKATKDALYDRAEFIPISKQDLEKLKITRILKGEPTNRLDSISVPAVALHDNRHLLYDQRYYNWACWYDPFGYMWVQTRSNCPSSRIGWGIFEKDTSRG